MTSDNPDGKKKALENLSVTVEENGITSNVPALSSYFATARSMTCFVSPPKHNEDGQFILGAKDSWLTKSNVYKSNMQWLLTLPHNRFWSQIVYGKDSWDSVITFLQEGYPFYLLDNLVDDLEITQMYYEIYYIVFQLIKRATTRKESEHHWIGAKKFGSLLYNYTIVSFPILIDVCVIYGENFKEDVQKIVNRVFSAQPVYKEDLNNSVTSIKSIFQVLEDQFSERSTLPGEVTKLSERKVTGQELPISKIQDVIFYLLDVSASLSTFLNFYTEAAGILHLHRFETNISTLYESIIPSLTNTVKVQCFKDDTMGTYFNLMLKLNHARYFLISLFRQCLEPTLNIILMKSGDSGDPALITYCDNYIDSLSNSFGYNIFISDYNNKFAIASELDMLMEICPEMDSEKFNFLKQALLNVSLKPQLSSQITNNSSKPSTSQHQQSKSTTHSSNLNNETTANNTTKPKDNQLKVMISEVKDILPQLGDGFIQCCLEHYKHSSADVINAILEDSLPPSLKSVDKELPFIPPEEGIPPACDPVLLNRINVFDFDDLDVMHRDDVDPSRVRIGKRKDKHKTFNDLINDKSFREEFREKYNELGFVADVYDDEYDDTYDGVDVIVPEVGEHEKKFVTPRVLQEKQRKEIVSESEEEEEDDVDDEAKNNLPRNSKFGDFVENPEDRRARYEQKWLSKTYNNTSKNVVVGDPNDQEVIKGRNNKNIRKASYANHNRKKGAKNKRMQGIVPS